MRLKTCGECEYCKTDARNNPYCRYPGHTCGNAVLPYAPRPGWCPLPADPAPDKINAEVTETMRKFKNGIEASTAAPKGISLNELQTELEKTLSLLRDRHPGLISWNEFLADHLRELRRLANEALAEEIE